ncbi:GNAT family N-acetyltransferase [bacterium]|nr:GNAT family N-acetyltransferase [bacterium]
MKLTFHPLTSENWKDFETLFGPKGACAGCWCMWFRLTRAEFEKQKGAGNKRAMKKIVTSGEVPGIIAYADGEPVGWCSVAPREMFTLLERSRVLKPVDDKPVWSVVCFFIDKAYRHQGVSVKLLKAAIEYVRKQGGKIVEGYAIEPKKGSTPDVFAYHGLAAAYRKAGFKEVLRRSPTRPIMRYVIRKK